jgi:acyl-CoA dehydrogenase
MIDFSVDPDFQERLDWARDFVKSEVLPLETLELTEAQWRAATDPLKQQVRERGLWAPHLPPELGGGGWDLVRQGLLYEVIGASDFAQIIFGNQAPDSGNAVLLAEGASEAQKDRWLKPLLAGEVRSAFSMTEPHTAGSDPTLLASAARVEGDEWVIDGLKWFTSSGMIADFYIVMVRTEPEAPPHRAFSMILVPAGTPGLIPVREIAAMSDPDGEIRAGHHSHAEVRYDGVRVPLENLIGERGQGFALAQTRLGPARTHRCMEWVAKARRAFEMMCERAVSREAFGGPLADKQSVQNWVADVASEIESARLMTLYTAWKIQQEGAKAARSEIAMIKFMTPRTLFNAVDRAIQVHGSLGYSCDMPLEKMYRDARYGPIVDGPDEVQRRTVARSILRRYEPTEVPSEHIPTRRAAAEEKFASVLGAVTDNS